MPAAQKYKSANGVKYRIQYTDPVGVRRTKTGFKTAKQANHWAANNLIQRNTGGWIDPQKLEPTYRLFHPRPGLAPMTCHYTASPARIYSMHILTTCATHRTKTHQCSQKCVKMRQI